MVGNPYRWRAVIPQLENRNATAGCLLAVLLFVPFLVKTFHVSVGAIILFIVIYVSIIVPIGTGIIPRKHIIRRLRNFSKHFLDEQQWTYYLAQASYISSWIHYIYLQVDGVQTFTTQVVFNVGAEKLFCPSQRFCCLYVLLFYSFLAYIQKSLQERPWTQLSNESSRAEFIKLTAAFVIIRLGKGVAVSLVFLTFSYHFHNLEPTYMFICITFLYFCLSQYQNTPFVKNTLTSLLSKLELQCLEGLEEYWVPVLIHSLAAGLSVFVFMGLIIHTNSYIILILLGYINFSLPLKYSLQPAWEMLCQQKAIISRFSLASWSNQQIRAGNPCAVCLDKMRFFSARVTPCGHVFHGSCLRKCFQYSKFCPLCKNCVCISMIYLTYSQLWLVKDLMELEILDFVKKLGGGVRHPGDDFYKEGNEDCQPLKPFGLCDFDDENFYHKPYLNFSCHIPGCERTFETVIEYESHYNSCHCYTCKECNKNLPNYHLLDLHISETHDFFFKAQAKQKSMYKCFLEECKDCFKNPTERKDHCIKVHKFPSDFRFDSARKMRYAERKNDKLNRKKPSSQEKMDLVESSEVSSKMVVTENNDKKSKKSAKFTGLHFGRGRGQRKPVFYNFSKDLMDSLPKS